MPSCQVHKLLRLGERFETRSPRKVDVNLIFKLQMRHILSHTSASFGLKAGMKIELVLAACAWKHCEGFANTAMCFNGSCYSTESGLLVGDVEHKLAWRHGSPTLPGEDKENVVRKVMKNTFFR